MKTKRNETNLNLNSLYVFLLIFLHEFFKTLYNLFSKSKIHQQCILPRKYNRQRRRLLFLVCLRVSEKSGVMRENCWNSRFGRSSSCFYSHFIISFKKYDMVAKTFLYIIIILCFVNKLNSSMSNFGGRLSQPKKIKVFLGISFPANIIQQVVDF
jgi:hypothetical protein